LITDRVNGATMSSSTLPDLVTEKDTAEAMATVLAVAETGDGTVDWERVSGEMGLEQWGKLVAEGVVIPVGDRFVVENPTAARAALQDADVDLPPSVAGLDADDPAALEPGAGGGWSMADKAAGVGALALASGYHVTAVREAVAPAVDVVLGPVAAALPFPVVVLVLAVATALFTTGLRNRIGTAVSDRMERQRKRSEELRQRLDDAQRRGDDDAVDRLQAYQARVVKDQLGVVVAGVKPVAYTMLLTIPVFLWLYWMTLSPNQAIAPVASVWPLVGEVVWTARVVGSIQAWMVWYFLCNLASGLVVKKGSSVLERLPVAV